MTVRLRVPLVLILVLLLTAISATAAFAFTARSGFSATTYASGYPSGGPAGVAFIGTTMYTADPADGGLYATAASGTLVRLGTTPGTPTALAAFGGSLYAIQGATNSVVQLNPANGAVLATLGTGSNFDGFQINGLAADPVNGDLYVSAAQGFLYVIRAPLLAAPSFLLVLNGQPATFGITVASDHSLYVAVEGLGASGVRQITPSLAQSPIGPDYAGARGLGIVPGYVFVNNADGSILKIAIPNVGVGNPVSALTGGAAGGLASIGADGCFYASQGPAVIRLANELNTGGPCTLGSAGPPPPPPTLTLVNTSLNQPLIGNGDQTFSASFAHLPAAANVPVTFTVTRGAVSTTYPATTGPNGTASFGYAASTPGTDVITASAVVNNGPLVSNAVSVTWPRALDTIKPTITYQIISGDHNAPGPNGAVFSCPNPTLGTPGVKEYCGWYTSPPTVHFTVTPGPGDPNPVTYNCPDFTLVVNSPIDGTPVTCKATNIDGLPASFTVVLQALTTPPTITAAAATISGPYVAGSWTNKNVTVSFACASDPNLGPVAVNFCSLPQVVSGEGSTTVSGFVLDVAGTRVNAAPTVVLIDKTAPIVSIATTKTADGAAYVLGTPTNQDVIVTFSCTDNLDPAPTCPQPVRVTSGPSVTVSGSDRAVNSQSYTFGGINIDRTVPTVSAAVSPQPDANGNNGLVANVTITGADANGIASITYSASGAQVIPTTTTTGATATVAITALGTTTVTFYATDAAGNVSVTGTKTVNVIAKQTSSLTITSTATLPSGAVTVSARLVGADGTSPVVGRTVTFGTGTTSVAAVTGPNGVATATLALAVGSYTLTATFAGDTAYFSSTATAQTLIVFQPTQFVIWGGNAGGAPVGLHAQLWGAKWAKQVTAGDYHGGNSFKGYADTVSGSTWSTKPGNSKPPTTIGRYISVIVTTSVQKAGGSGDDEESDDSKSAISGNVASIVVIRVDDPASYKADPGHPASGTIVAVVR